MKSFNSYNFPQSLLHSLNTIGFKEPTPIQEQSIPVVISGQDILGSAQTGTGKTGAYAIPLVAKLLNNPDERALILTPTRELATQVIKVFHQLLSSEKLIKSALLIGGESIAKQFIALKSAPRLIVGTPGRINDHLKRGTLKIYNVHSLVMDETDRMLDMGFGVQIEKIIDKLPEDRQTLMFSATFPKNIENLANKYLKDAVRVKIGDTTTPVMRIKQNVLMVSEKEKYSQLIEQLDQRAGSIIVFVKTKRGADDLTSKLNREDYRSDAIHGDLRQNKRDRVINAFRKEHFRIMVATDIAARGLDIPHIRHVINYDLPQCPEDYIHRLGRTARAGENGEAISFITKGDRGKWSAIERMMSPDKKEYYSQQPQRAKSQGGRPKRRAPSRDEFQEDRPQRSKSFRGQSRRDEFQEDRPQGSRPFRGKSRRDEFQEDRPQRSKSFRGQSRRDEFQEDRPQGSKPFRGKSRRDEFQEDRPQGGRPFRGKSRRDEFQEDRPQGSRPFRGKSRRDEFQEDRPQGNRPFRGKSQREEYQGDRPQGGRPFRGKSQREEYQGDRPLRSKSFRGKSQRDDSQGERPQRGKSFRDKRQGDRPLRDQPRKSNVKKNQRFKATTH